MGYMKRSGTMPMVRVALVGLFVGCAVLEYARLDPAVAQTSLDVKTAPPADPRELEIVAPSAGARDVTRPREADFYREDIRVRHEPGFVEPLTTRPASGPVKTIGLSGWTA